MKISSISNSVHFQVMYVRAEGSRDQDYSCYLPTSSSWETLFAKGGGISLPLSPFFPVLEVLPL